MEATEGNSEAMREKKKREGERCEELKMVRHRRENGRERKRAVKRRNCTGKGPERGEQS